MHYQGTCRTENPPYGLNPHQGESQQAPQKLCHRARISREYIKKLDAQVNLNRKIVGKKPFDRDNRDDDPSPKSDKQKAQRLTNPDAQILLQRPPNGGQQTQRHCQCSCRTDETPVLKILNEAKQLGYLPDYMGTQGTATRRLRIYWKRRAYGASLTADGICAPESITGNIAFDTTLKLTCISARKSNRSTGESPPRPDTGNTTATARSAGNVRSEKNALERTQPGGWGKGIYGRTRWTSL